MAKGKSTSSGKLQSATSSKRNASASGNGRSPAPAKKSTAAGQREISAAEIGNVAGQVWACLSEDGEQTLAAIKKSIDAPADVVVAAIGWLAREDKLDFSTTGRAVKICLR
ncbi:MAG: winged helix-turn-helix domain-containing protein [Pirellulales bacterium]